MIDAVCMTAIYYSGCRGESFEAIMGIQVGLKLGEGNKESYEDM